MTVEDFLKLCGIPDDDDSLSVFIINNADSSHFADCVTKKPEFPADCQCCVYGYNTPIEGIPKYECDNKFCRDGIVEYLNLKHEGPIPVVCKPFSYQGDVVDSFSIGGNREGSVLVLYDDDDDGETSVIAQISLTKKQDDTLLEAASGGPAWQWNCVVDMFGDKEPVTIITEEDA